MVKQDETRSFSSSLRVSEGGKRAQRIEQSLAARGSAQAAVENLASDHQFV